MDEGYVFDNAASEAGGRLDILASIYDDSTIRHLERLNIEQDWHCLEVGGGGGSIASWLCERAGHVVATDVDMRFLAALGHPNLEVLRHDVAADPLPAAAFDLVHARLVLVHLPERERALENMVAALKPEGWLLLEEFDALSSRADPAIEPAEMLLKSLVVLQEVMASRGVDARFGRKLAARMIALGMVDVEGEGLMSVWRGGSPGARFYQANFEQTRPALVATGRITNGEIDHDLKLLDEPSYLSPSPTMWSVRGRRPR